MKLLVSKRGFTLLEVIISLAIFAVIFIIFSGMFAGGVKNVFSAGYKSKAQFYSQQAMENRLTGTSAAVANTTSTLSGTVLAITFTNSSGVAIADFSVTGAAIDVHYDDTRRSFTLDSFKAD